MSIQHDWLEQGLADLPADQAQRLRLLRTLLATAAQLRNQLDKVLAPSGITSQQAALLQCIEAHPQPPTLTELARAMAMSHQNVKQIATALERKGFVQTTVDERDRRAKRLLLTQQHHQFWQARNPGDFSQVVRWTAGLSTAEAGQAVRLLCQLKAGLSQADAVPPAPAAAPANSADAPRRSRR